jgi:hypothetical protein
MEGQHMPEADAQLHQAEKLRLRLTSTKWPANRIKQHTFNRLAVAAAHPGVMANNPD